MSEVTTIPQSTIQESSTHYCRLHLFQYVEGIEFISLTKQSRNYHSMV